MVKAGDTITAVETGETFTFLKTAADTNGKLLQIYMTIAPRGGAKGAPAHIHPIQEERFYLKKGEITFLLNGEQFTQRAGESVIVPPGAAHTWRNETDQEAEFVLEFEPALQWEAVFEGLCSLSRQGKLSADGKVNPLQLAMSLNKYKDHMYIAGLPVGLQKVFFAGLAVIGRLMGMTTELPSFEAVEQPSTAQATI